MPDRLRSALVVLTAALGVYASVLAVSGGFDTRVAGVRIRSRSWERPAVLAAAGAAVLLWQSRRRVRAAAGRIWIEADTERGGRALAIGAAAWTAVAAVSFGTFAVGGSDSYGYVSQARLLAQGRVTDTIPLARELAWPDVEATLTPLGYTRGRSPGVIAPTYPPGYPLLMAPFTAWERAVHLVVPLLGVLTVWLTFRVGAMCGDPFAGGWAAVLLSLSATFLFQLFQPMSDVPAAGSWLAALRLAGSADRSGQALRLAGLADRSGQAPRLAAAALSGTVTALAILIRPNLAPLAVIVAALAVGPGSAGRVRRLIAWAAPVLAGAVLLGSIQYVRYGSVLASGYGSLFDLFSLANVVPNLERYPRWITGTQTIAIWLWLAAPIWIVRRSTNRALPAGAWALTLVVWASYLSYAAFGEHEWTYTRFLLPALPLMLFFCAALALAFVRWLPPGARAAAAIVLLGTLAMSTLAAARSHGVFSVRQQEQRYPDVGAFVRTKLPAATFVLAVQHSGSIRYYANRPTLRWDLLDPARLDDAVGMLRSGGYIPVLVVDAAEEIEFRERFGRAGQQAVSRLSQLARYASTGVYGFD